MKKKILSALFGTENPVSLVPGILLSAAVMTGALILSRQLGELVQTFFGMSKSLVSMFLVAILLGMTVRNTIKLPDTLEPGIKFCLAKLLRLGIIFLGIRLSVLEIARIGAVSFCIAIACVITGILATTALARLFHVESRLGTLIAAGTGICGVSAIIAVSPCVNAREEETTYAVSTITIFGLIVTILYPYMAEMVLRLNMSQAGIFLGTSIHDTAQVTGAAFIYDQLWQTDISPIAITTKLVRNMLMIGVIPVLAMVYARRNVQCPTQENMAGSYMRYFPKFILGFLALALFRSIGDWQISSGGGSFLCWASTESWRDFYLLIKSSAKYTLAIAIAAAGLSTRFSKLKELSYKPFLIGLGAAVAVGGMSLLLVTLLKTPVGNLLLNQ